jgi:hypothetical protein
MIEPMELTDEVFELAEVGDEALERAADGLALKQPTVRNSPYPATFCWC